MADVYINLTGEGRMPQYASKHAAGCDLFATRDMVIRPGETKIMPLDFTMAIDTDMEAQIRPRSGLSLKTQLRIPNGPGTIDSDYRDTVGVILQNTYNIANLPYQIAADPKVLEDLRKNYREVSLNEYLAQYCGVSLGEASALHITPQKYISMAGKSIRHHIHKKDERIAQMVLSKYGRANFIEHPNPREIRGQRRGLDILAANKFINCRYYCRI
jgi:dUTP pyrophosphatase